MQIAVLLFDRFHAVDAVIPYERLSRIPGAHVTFVAERIGPVRSDTGRLVLHADAELAELPHPDVLLIPGGAGRDAHLGNGAVHRWLRAAAVAGTRMVGIGDGALILGAAGISDSTTLDDAMQLASTSTPKGPLS